MTDHFKTDVLIIGTGGAGLRAAIEADRIGAQVTLVSKAPAGYNNATIVAGGGFHAAVGGLTPEEHLENTLRVGKGINDPYLVKILCNEGGTRVLELKDFGVEMRVQKGGVHVGDIPGIYGQGMTKPLVEYIRGRGVQIFENVIITKILKDHDRVVGAVGYSSGDAEAAVFSCKSVVLTTGGAGALYKRTDCPLKTTGDGYSLAYHAGARLRDMEFIQFFPLALAEPGAPPFLIDGPIVEKGKIVNTLGTEIPVKYGVTERPFILKSRDLLSRAIMMEILEGGEVDGAVFIDARAVFKEIDPKELFTGIRYDFFIKKIQAHKRPFRVAPICHFTMGGIVTDIDGYTGVPGLYAAGEVVGGVHGANRHGGNALTAITVFGARAGASAARNAETRDCIYVESIAEPEVKRYARLDVKDIGYLPRTVMDQLRGIMWEKVGVVRDSPGLLEGYETISELRDTCRLMSALPGRQRMYALEVPMALDVAEMIIRSAMNRHESRGAHFRKDYPEENPEWLKTTILRKKGKAMQLYSSPLNNVFKATPD
jgi:fumarate reductase (CoM/CoB) subunit A